MSQANVRVGLLAYGAIGDEHNMAIKATPGLSLAAVGTTGILSLISQLAIIREAGMIVKDLAKAKTNTGKIIAASGSYLQLTQVVMVLFGIGLFALIVSAIW